MSTSIGQTNLTFPSGATMSTIPVDKGQLISVDAYRPSPPYYTYHWVNPGATYVVVKLVGGGGGGSAYCESGGAGGYAEGLFNVAGVATVSVTIGGGGAGSAYAGPSGTGGTSSFGSYISATGGNGANSSYGHSGGNGGVGSGGQVNLQGGGGGGHVNSSGSNTQGRGGWSYFGGGSSRVRNHGNNSLYGPQPGGAPGTGGPGQMSDGYATGSTDAVGISGLVVVYSYK